MDGGVGVLGGWGGVSEWGSGSYGVVNVDDMDGKVWIEN